MKFRDLASLTAFVAIIVLAITYIGSFGIRLGPPDDRADLSMQVVDINGLVVDSRVLLRGVPVGKVTGIEAGVEHATVNFYIAGDHRVPSDSVIRLGNLSALGETYIEVIPRTYDGPVFEDGQRIETDMLEQPPSVSELATSVVRVLEQLGPDELRQILDEADQSLPDPDVALPNLSRTSMLLRNTTAGMDGRGKEVLANFQTLLQNADWVGPTLADLVPHLYRLGPAMQGMYYGFLAMVLDGNPEQLENFKKFMDRIQGFLDTRAPDIKVIAEALLPKMNGVAGSLMNFDSGRILSNTLARIPEDGAITLRVTVPPEHR